MDLRFYELADYTWAHMRRLLLGFILLTSFGFSNSVAQSGLDWTAISDVLLNRMKLNTGENVLLVASPGRFDPLIELLSKGIVDAGGNYLGTISIDGSAPTGWNTDFTKGAAGKVGEQLQEYFENVDLGVMMPGATPGHAPYQALQHRLEEGQGRTVHFHWAGAYDLNGQPLGPDPRIDPFYQNAILETDYDRLRAHQRLFEGAMRGKSIRVTTPSGTDISFEIGNRPVTRQDGDASAAEALTARNLIDREKEIPAGAVRVAPLEETVHGVVAFPNGMWSGERVEGLKITFEKGKVVRVQASSGTQAAVGEINAAGSAGKSFREFALGMNPQLAIPESDPWIPYYGYGAGVVRLSLGNNKELGGNVSGDYVRWNFFIDATVYLGDEVWVRSGKMIR